jgi:hypothetical protein
VSIRRSHGKARPELPRARDLEASDAVGTPPLGRTPGGHFAAGNRLGIGNRWKNTVRKALGNRAAAGEVGIVAGDAQRVMANVLRSLPSDAAPVRVLVAVHARHVALNAYYTRLAEAAGLATPEGLKLLEVADRQSQRAERTLVTCHDLARIHAQQSPRSDGAWEQAALARLHARQRGEPAQREPLDPGEGDDASTRRQ